MADKWTPPGLDRAEFERQEAHNERLIQVQMNRPWTGTSRQPGAWL